MTRSQIISAIYDQRAIATRVDNPCSYFPFDIYRTVLLTPKQDVYTVYFKTPLNFGAKIQFAVDLIQYLQEDEQVKRAKQREHKKQQNRKHQQQWRAANVIRDIWNHLRSNAARRKIVCTISLEDFTEWCVETGYHLLRGRARDSASIDRKIPELGYVKGNLQVLTVAKNAAKRWTDAGYYKQNKLFNDGND